MTFHQQSQKFIREARNKHYRVTPAVNARGNPVFIPKPRGVLVEHKPLRNLVNNVEGFINKIKSKNKNMNYKPGERLQEFQMKKKAYLMKKAYKMAHPVKHKKVVAKKHKLDLKHPSLTNLKNNVKAIGGAIKKGVGKVIGARKAEAQIPTESPDGLWALGPNGEAIGTTPKGNNLRLYRLKQFIVNNFPSDHPQFTEAQNYLNTHSDPGGRLTGPYGSAAVTGYKVIHNPNGPGYKNSTPAGQLIRSNGGKKMGKKVAMKRKAKKMKSVKKKHKLDFVKNVVTGAKAVMGLGGTRTAKAMGKSASQIGKMPSPVATFKDRMQSQKDLIDSL